MAEQRLGTDLAVKRLGRKWVDHERLAVERLAVEHLAVPDVAHGTIQRLDQRPVLHLAVCRVEHVHRVAVEHLAVERLGPVEHLAVEHLAVERLAVCRVAVERVAIERVGQVLRVAECSVGSVICLGQVCRVGRQLPMEKSSVLY